MKNCLMPRMQGILIILLIAVNVLFILKIIAKQKDAERMPTIQGSDYAIRSLTEAGLIGYETEGLPISLKNNQDSLFLLTLVHNRVLILRISDTHCEACTTEALSDLLENSASLDVAVIVLSNFINKRTLDIFKLSYPNYYVLNEESIDLPVERINTPYMFITNRSMLTDMVFVHQKEFPEKTQGYFSVLKDRYKR